MTERCKTCGGDKKIIETCPTCADGVPDGHLFCPDCFGDSDRLVVCPDCKGSGTKD